MGTIKFLKEKMTRSYVTKYRHFLKTGIHFIPVPIHFRKINDQTRELM
ncbi:hypothetical protein MKMG_01480 [Methanogenium sp. MK-MG]|nr:hypothetical protein MKMG_01480 [Methanogenium sp. MK-MG]